MLGNLGPTYRRFGGELHRPIARVEDTVELWLQLTTQAPRLRPKYQFIPFRFIFLPQLAQHFVTAPTLLPSSGWSDRPAPPDLAARARAAFHFKLGC
jgi:hypothetical protein